MTSVLLVEDSPDDALIMQRAWKKAGLAQPLSLVDDGQKAVDYLSGTGPWADRQKHPLPCLVLLDLKLPYLSGLEVVSWIRAHEPCSRMPVIFLTASHSEKDIQQAYTRGATAYLVKPPTPDELVRMLTALKDFWFTHNNFLPECLAS